MDAVRAKLPIRIYSVENLKIVSEWNVVTRLQNGRRKVGMVWGIRIVLRFQAEAITLL